MFSRRESQHKRKGGGLLGLLRLLLSLIILSILALGFYQAYKSFSGFDPLKLDPKSVANQFLSSDSAVSLVSKLFSLQIPSSIDEAKQLLNEDKESKDLDPNKPMSPLLYKFAIVADSHNDNQNLAKALERAKNMDVKFIIGVGDYTDVGTVEELSEAKKRFDAVGLTYYLIPGDHDLWDSRDKKNPPTKNFHQVFGLPYQAFSYNGTRYILFNNADNYLGVDQSQIKWLEDQLERVKQGDQKITFMFTSIPLFHPSSDHVMGKTESRLKDQAEHLISISNSAGVDEVFAGDTHFFSRYKDPKYNLQMTSVGSVASTRNPQAPRFVVVDIFEDGSYNIEDLEIQ